MYGAKGRPDFVRPQRAPKNQHTARSTVTLECKIQPARSVNPADWCRSNPREETATAALVSY
jgi:hypothetical protein